MIADGDFRARLQRLSVMMINMPARCSALDIECAGAVLGLLARAEPEVLAAVEPSAPAGCHPKYSGQGSEFTCACGDGAPLHWQRTHLLRASGVSVELLLSKRAAPGASTVEQPDAAELQAWHDMAERLQAGAVLTGPEQRRAGVLLQHACDLASKLAASGQESVPAQAPSDAPDASEPAEQGEQTVARPTTAAQVREFVGSNFISLRYGMPSGATDELGDHPPHHQDVYELSARDLLSAFGLWAGAAQPAEDNLAADREVFDTWVKREAGEWAARRWHGTDAYDEPRVQDYRVGWNACLEMYGGRVPPLQAGLGPVPEACRTTMQEQFSATEHSMAFGWLQGLATTDGAPKLARVAVAAWRDLATEKAARAVAQAQARLDSTRRL